MLNNKERWLELCALAAEEQDADRLMDLIAEITALLEAKEKRLKGSEEPQEVNPAKKRRSL